MTGLEALSLLTIFVSGITMGLNISTALRLWRDR